MVAVNYEPVIGKTGFKAGTGSAEIHYTLEETTVTGVYRIPVIKGQGAGHGNRTSGTHEFDTTVGTVIFVSYR